MTTVLRALLIVWLLLGGGAFAALGSFGYFLNYQNTGDPVMHALGLFLIAVAAAVTSAAIIGVVRDTRRKGTPTP